MNNCCYKADVIHMVEGTTRYVNVSVVDKENKPITLDPSTPTTCYIRVGSNEYMPSVSIQDNVVSFTILPDWTIGGYKGVYEVRIFTEEVHSIIIGSLDIARSPKPFLSADGEVIPSEQERVRYYTRKEVDELVSNIVIDQLDLSNYYTKPEVDRAIESIDIPETDLSNYYTKAEVDSAIEGIDIPETDLSNYYTKSEVDNAIESIDIPETDLSNYYTKTEVDSAIESIDIPEPDLSNYYTKSEVDNAIENIDIPSGLPEITQADNGKFLRVNNGEWSAETIPQAEGSVF